MIVELWHEGYPLDLYEDTEIKHTLQVNDVAEVKDRQSSYTDSFSIPKTPNNVRRFNGLGLHSNSSNVPYQKPNGMLRIEGFDFLTQAWLNVKETDDDYKVYIYSGIIEFFKKFENKTVGEELAPALTEINHNKNLATVLNTQTDDSLKYTYLFADFNGRTHRRSDSTVVNIDYVVPSVLVSYLFEKVHEHFGYTFTGSFIGTEDYENWWLSYPKAPEDTTSVTYFTGSDTFTFSFQGQNNEQSDAFNLSFNNGTSNGIKFLESGVYNFNISGGAGTDSPRPSGVSGYADVNFFYSINGGSLISFPNPENVNIPMQADDVIIFYYTVYSDWNGNGNISVVIKSLEDVQFDEELKDLNITDFLKDVYNTLGLTPFVDNVNKHIDYRSNKERFKDADVEDWSDYLISSGKESYSFGTYAQKNYFRYKYNDQEETHNDASLTITNENLEADKTIFTSFTYGSEDSAKNGKSSFYINATNTIDVDVFKLYEKEAQDGTTDVKYKPLSKRYFYLRLRKLTMDVNIGSDIQLLNGSSPVIKLGEFAKLKMDYFLGQYYTDFLNVIDNPVIWNATLKVPYPKLLKFDQSKAYYFRQLQQYCIINKITFDKDSTTAELVRIKDFRV